MRLDLFVHFDPLVIGESTATADALATLTTAVQQLTQKVTTMSGTQDTLTAELANLTASVTAETTVTQSAITLINGIPGMISSAVASATAAGATPEQLAAFNTLSQTIAANSSSLASAVTANTPPAPAPAPTPAPAAPTPPAA